jgi:hypothetical protein
VSVDDAAVQASGVLALETQHLIKGQEFLVGRAGIPLGAHGAVANPVGERVGLISHSCFSNVKSRGSIPSAFSSHIIADAARTFCKVISAGRVGAGEFIRGLGLV